MDGFRTTHEAGVAPCLPACRSVLEKSVINETAGGQGIGFAERNFLSSIQFTGQCLVDQLADGLDDPAPCCVAVVIVTRGEIVSAVQHQGGGASDFDLGNQRSPRDKLIGMMTVRRR